MCRLGHYLLSMDFDQQYLINLGILWAWAQQSDIAHYELEFIKTFEFMYLGPIIFVKYLTMY